MSNKIKSSNFKNMKKNSQNATLEAFKEIMEYIVAAFCIVLCVFLPLYLRYGYSNVGDSKFMAYKWIASVGLGIISAVGIAYLVMANIKYILFTKTDVCCLAFVVLSFIAAVVGGHFGECWMGYPGWYMGIFAQITFVLIYFYISRFGRFDKTILNVFLVVMGLVFLIGVLHRMMIDPIDVYYLGTADEIADHYKNDFLSTMGQVSWYSSFVATTLPLALGIFWCSNERKERILSGIVSMLGFLTLTSQNSDSAYMALAGFVMVFFWFSVSDVHKMERFWELAFMFVLSTRIMYLLLIIHPNEIIEFDTFSEFMINNQLMWILTVIVGLIWAYFFFVAEKKNKYSVKAWTVMRYVGLGLLTVIVLGAAVIIILSATGNTPDFIAEKTADISYLNWNDDWGNHRGMSWTVNVYIFRDLPIVNKLFGVGPDGYAFFAYDNFGDMLENMFPGLTLSNAHNEWMNTLICYGIVGATAYIGIFVLSIADFAKKTLNNPKLVGVIACIVSYMAHNFFCYQQVCCTPFMFVIIGLGAYIYREEIRGEFEQRVEEKIKAKKE